MKYTESIELEVPYEQAVPRVKEAFKAQGFGTLTEIDVKATLKEKLGKDVEPYVILGTCNPQLSARALEVEPEIGALLPCNVVVRYVSERTTAVHALEPEVIASLSGRPELRDLAEEAKARIRAALDSLSSETARTT